MHVSQKCQYTLRALFELAKRRGAGPVTVTEIAEAQQIPPRFLELILQGLKSAGRIESRRGSNGGYLLTAPPRTITVGSIIRMVDGSLAPVQCITDHNEPACALHDKCAFMGLWRRAEAAVEEVYDATTLQDLIDDECAAARSAGSQLKVVDFAI